MFENFIIIEVMKNALNKGARPDLYFWSDSTGNEIDLIVQQGQQLYPVEIKSADTLRPEFFKNLELFQKLSGTPPDDCYLIYQGAEHQDRSNGKVRGWQGVPEF